MTMDILHTADGSPTLSLSGGEKMHSMDGAFSESLFIYGSNIEKSTGLESPQILSMGLGLGYNEIMTSSFFLSLGIKDYGITSFESVPELRTHFISWLDGKGSPLNQCYDEILELFSKHYSVSKDRVREDLNNKFNLKNFLIFKELTLKNDTHRLHTNILYDAFSSNTNKELWDKDFLVAFIDNYCDSKFCYFSTYAATSALKKALKEKGFTLEKREGFSRKRESTFAHRL